MHADRQSKNIIVGKCTKKTGQSSEKCLVCMHSASTSQLYLPSQPMPRPQLIILINLDETDNRFIEEINHIIFNTRQCSPFTATFAEFSRRKMQMKEVQFFTRCANNQN